MPVYDYKPLPKLSQADLERFWNYISISKDTTACWPWIGPIKEGYGRFGYAHQQRLKSHRIAYFLYTGNDPGQFHVCHSCDYKPCCNPLHLHLGTIQTNAQEARERGLIAKGDNHWSRRHPELTPRGENAGIVRLTKENVLLIRKLRVSGVSVRELVLDFSAKLDVSKTAIYHVLTYSTWKHLP